MRVESVKHSHINIKRREAVLVIHHDTAVLVLLRGILAEQYRVLLAKDAEGAMRLARLGDVPIDLVLSGHHTPGTRNARELQSHLMSLRPDLAVLSFVGSVEEQVIKIRMS